MAADAPGVGLPLSGLHVAHDDWWCECGVYHPCPVLDAPQPSARDLLIAAIEALPVHSMGGYEAECDKCFWRTQAEGIGPTDSRASAHQNLLDRDRVLEVLRGAR